MQDPSGAMARTSNHKPYELKVHWHPAFELLTSLHVYMHSALRRVSDLGSEWRRTVKGMLPPAYAARLESLAKGPDFGIASWLAFVLAWAGSERWPSLEDLLSWAEDLEQAELYACIGDHLPQTEGPLAAVTTKLLADPGRYRDAAVTLMRGWHEAYFRTLDPAILAGLAQEAAEQRLNLPAAEPAALVESLSRGLVLAPPGDIRTVALVPQHHARPWNTFEHLRDTLVIAYPAEILRPAPGQPPTRLVRLTKALNDPNRLRILRFIATAPRGFGEIVSHLGLAKSTVHHHLVTLRAAGLLRWETRLGLAGEGRAQLSLAGLDELMPQLMAFLKAQDNGSEPEADLEAHSIGLY